jgi:hypothetical protein
LGKAGFISRGLVSDRVFPLRILAGKDFRIQYADASGGCILPDVGMCVHARGLGLGRGAMKRVFISFRAEDRNKVNGLRLLAANPDFDIEFYDESVRTPYNSNDPAYIRRMIREKIGRTSVTVCMVSELTHTSQWVTWELEESIDKGSSIICMGFKDGPGLLTLPEPARRLKLPWYSWDHDALYRMIAAAP